MTELTTGELAKKVGVNVETIRYYERRGLIPEPPRRESGHRQYSDNAVERVLFIKHAKELGFSLKEILELFALRVDPRTTCADVKRQAEDKLSDIDEKLNMLQRFKIALEKLSSSCIGRGPISECPILDALQSDSKVNSYHN